MRIIGGILAAIAAAHIIGAAHHHMVHHMGRHAVAARAEQGFAMVPRPWPTQY